MLIFYPLPGSEVFFSHTSVNPFLFFLLISQLISDLPLLIQSCLLLRFDFFNSVFQFAGLFLHETQLFPLIGLNLNDLSL
jgi:hypothetical protein